MDSVYSNKITPHNLSWGLERKNNQLNVGVILEIENAHKGAEITDKIIQFNKLYPDTEYTSLSAHSIQDGTWLEDTITQYLQASSNKKDQESIKQLSIIPEHGVLILKKKCMDRTKFK